MNQTRTTRHHTRRYYVGAIAESDIDEAERDCAFCRRHFIPRGCSESTSARIVTAWRAYKNEPTRYNLITLQTFIRGARLEMAHV